MASLSTLPTELLQTIATFLPYRAFLSLTQVNREFRSACDQKIILLQIAKYGHLNDSGAVDHIRRLYSERDQVRLDPGRLHWLQGDGHLKDASYEDAQRLARIVTLCIQESQKKDEDWDEAADQPRFLNWLPHLLALQHPISLGIEPTRFLWVLQDFQQFAARDHSEMWAKVSSSSQPQYCIIADEFVAACFVLNFLTLQRHEVTWNKKDVAWAFRDCFLINEIPKSENDTDLSPLDRFVKELFARLLKRERFGSSIAMSEASSILLPLMLGLIVQFSAIGHSGDLPKPSKMPFDQLMDIPAIDRQDAGAIFADCHLRTMTSPQFLTGKWLGYYTHERDPQGRPMNNFFEPRMFGITIHATSPPGKKGRVSIVRANIDESSSGSDYHGNFILYGVVYVNGKVDLTKHYTATTHQRTWVGRITPFGIVGIWGEQTFRGHLWIWKEEWA